LDAYDYNLRGLFYMSLLNPEDSQKAFQIFLKAIEIDPGYARAYANASWYYRRQVQTRGMVLTDAEKAECLRLAEFALKSAPMDPEVLYQVALSVGLIGGNLERGLGLAEQALAINSNGTRIWLTAALIQNCLGDPEAAVASAEHAIRLNPHELAMWVAHGELSKAHIQLADYEAALGWARRSVEKHDNNFPVHHVLIASLAQLDHVDDADAALNRLLELDPGLTIKRLLEDFQLSRYRNLDGMLDGLRKAGLPE
jgi:tetratricopeptide (TPR) repeat protein